MFQMLILVLAATGVPDTQVVKIECPEWIYTRQEIAVEVRDWEGWETERPRLNQVEDPAVHRHAHSGFGFYYDHPSRTIELRADSSELPATFTFGNSENVWVCHYNGTVINFTRQIGAGFSRCVLQKEEVIYGWKEVALCYRPESVFYRATPN